MTTCLLTFNWPGILQVIQCNGWELGMEPTKGAFELTKHSEVSSIASKVGSMKFTDIALDNDFIPYYSGDKFKKREVNSGKRR